MDHEPNAQTTSPPGPPTYIHTYRQTDRRTDIPLSEEEGQMAGKWEVGAVQVVDAALAVRVVGGALPTETHIIT